MNIAPTFINGVSVVTTNTLVDSRGMFARLFCEQELNPVLDGRHIVQINHSSTTKLGAVRGLHYQHSPYAEMKFVRCIKGRVWDVAVDLRAGSPTFLQWYAQELSADNRLMLIIPEGCAHGFQVLEPNSELLYLHTSVYSREAESGVAYNDPKLAIDWPLAITDLSIRDQKQAVLESDFSGVNL